MGVANDIIVLDATAPARSTARLDSSETVSLREVNHLATNRAQRRAT